MEREVKKGKERSKDILKRTLQQTRECRSKDKKKLTAGQMLEEYSAFKVPGMLLWEFSDSYNIPITNLRRNWLDALPKLLTFLPSTSRIDVNGQTVHVLLNLPKQFHIKNKENRKDLLTVYKVNTLHLFS
ncbi:uncharacterized protein LOC122504782 [Leptopilina heterotoma]|uniref:uncharacterized protein LOC122504782 n=1 Tax=Leptopilina heterotoma TaxID=63436 RepID=UPI001CA96DB3|nr:uncharacterized protein LOC122504782 [Leptopilina heterotoma]